MTFTTTHNSIWLIPLTTPDLLAWVLLAIMGATMTFLLFLPANRRSSGGLLCLLFRDLGIEIVAVGVICVNLTIMLVATYNPRYLIFSLPWLFVLVGRSWLSRPTLRPAIQILLVGIIVLNLVNAHGSLYPSYRHVFERVPNFFWNRERSLEVVDDLASDRAAVDFVVKNHADKIIYCESPFGVLFSLPELGSVEHPLQGYCYGVFSDFMPGMRHAELTDVLDRHGPENVVVVGRYLAQSLNSLGARKEFAAPGYPPVGVWLLPKQPKSGLNDSKSWAINPTRLIWNVVDSNKVSDKILPSFFREGVLVADVPDAYLVSQAFKINSGQTIQLKLDFESPKLTPIEIILGRTPELDFYQQWVRKATIDQRGQVAIDAVAVMTDPQARIFIRRLSNAHALTVSNASLAIHPSDATLTQTESSDSQ